MVTAAFAGQRSHEQEERSHDEAFIDLNFA
jgi:hypothetical protein